MGWIAWELNEPQRADLLKVFPPAYPDVIAHHVTYAFGVDETYPMPPPTEGAVVGIVDDGQGVQALVVSIDGSTDRPDGSTYHITWSIDRAAGRKPVDSNKVIKAMGWKETFFHTFVHLTPHYYAR